MQIRARDAVGVTSVEISALLSAQLAALTECAEPGTDLERQLRALLGALRSAPYLLGLSLTTLVGEDQVTLHLGATGSGRIVGLTELSVVNQAIGVLMDRGYTAAAARRELRRRADATGEPLFVAAHRLMRR
jgi:hypothetical protein